VRGASAPSLGPERVAWVCVSVTGVSPDDAEIGHQASWESRASPRDHAADHAAWPSSPTPNVERQGTYKDRWPRVVGVLLSLRRARGGISSATRPRCAAAALRYSNGTGLVMLNSVTAHVTSKRKEGTTRGPVHRARAASLSVKPAWITCGVFGV
jgi:hypothetical protein